VATMAIPLFLFGAAIFFSSFLLFLIYGLLSALRFPILPQPWFWGPRPDVILIVTFLALALGAGFALLAYRLRPWRAQALIYVLLWAQSVLFLFLFFTLQTMSGPFPWLWMLPVFIGMCLCSANLFLLPIWLAALAPTDERSTTGSPFPYFLVAIACFGGIGGWLACNCLPGAALSLDRWKSGYCAVGLFVLASVVSCWKRWGLTGIGSALVPRESRPIFHERLRWVLLAGVPFALTQSPHVFDNRCPISPAVIYLISLAVAFSCTPTKHRSFIWSALIQTCGILSLLAALLTLPLPREMTDRFAFQTALVAAVFVLLPNRIARPLQLCLAGGFVAVDLAYVIDPGYLFHSSYWMPFSLFAIGPMLSTWLVCHRQLAKDRPETAYLPEYLFCIALGHFLAVIIFWLMSFFLPVPLLAFPFLLVLACVICYLPAATASPLQLAK
jgi:hypothetical protein